MVKNEAESFRLTTSSGGFWRALLFFFSFIRFSKLDLSRLLHEQQQLLLMLFLKAPWCLSLTFSSNLLQKLPNQSTKSNTHVSQPCRIRLNWNKTENEFQCWPRSKVSIDKNKKMTEMTKNDNNWGKVQVNHQQLIDFQDRGATCSRSKNVERRGKSDLELEKFSRRFFFLFPPLNFDVLDIECLHVSTIHFQGWGGEGEEWVILHCFLRSHGSQTFQVFFDWLLCYHQTSSIVVRKNYFLISKMEEIIVCSGHPTVRRRCSRGVVQELKEAQTHLKGNWK